MSELKEKIYDESTGIDYILAGDYYVPAIELAQERCQLIIRQLADAEGVDSNLKRWSQWEWLKAMNSVVSRAEEIVMSEMIFV